LDKEKNWIVYTRLLGRKRKWRSMDIRKHEEGEERDRNQTTQNMKKLHINIRVHLPLQSYATP
jgi:hypothetical protein